MGEEKVNMRNALTRRSRSSKTPSPSRMDSVRFSMFNLEESQDVELDEILGELCELENQFDEELARPSSSYETRLSRLGHKRSSRHSFSGNSRHSDAFDGDYDRKGDPHCDSPDNDSAFSDNASLLSSESSICSGVRIASRYSQDRISRRISALQIDAEKDHSSANEIATRIKAEKIKIALEKIKEASIKKIFVKVFTSDMSSKSFLADEKMVVGHVCRLLADKNHISMDLKWTLVENCPDLFMERIYEDHEFLVENLLTWSRDMTNQLYFLKKDEKYDLFLNPENYLLTDSETLDEDGKLNLIEEFFSSSGVIIPDVESYLHLRTEGKKSWKKYFFVLRASGIYYSPKGKSKMTKDLVCLTTFEMNNVYYGYNWKKKFKAPTDFGFAIKHPQIQNKSSKYIKYLCAEDDRILKNWITGIRIAKYGYQLKENYDNLIRELMEEDLDQLAHARSFSISSMAKALTVSPNGSTSSGSPEEATTPQALASPVSSRSSGSTPTPTPLDWKGDSPKIIYRKDSIKSSASSSSGCPSETSIPTPLVEDHHTVSKISKSKKNFSPKLPLTGKTFNLAKNAEETLIIESMTPKNEQIRPTCFKEVLSNGLANSSIPEVVPDKEVEMELEDEFSEDFLPPPPPEAFRGSQESLPPPPSPLPFNEESSWPSTSSLNSLPPPPEPLTPTNENQFFPSPPVTLRTGSLGKNSNHRRFSEADMEAPALDNGYLNCSTLKAPGKPPQSQVIYDALNNHSTNGNIAIVPSTIPEVDDSHNYVLQTAPLPPPPPPPPPPFNSWGTTLPAKKVSKPPPPRRSEHTKLSEWTSQTLGRNAHIPSPECFLKDLQQVMEKKWKVAQQLNTDTGSTAQQILGFRDPVYLPSENVTSPTYGASKKPPPPPPRRSENTHLSKQ